LPLLNLIRFLSAQLSNHLIWYLSSFLHQGAGELISTSRAVSEGRLFQPHLPGLTWSRAPRRSSPAAAQPGSPAAGIFLPFILLHLFKSLPFALHLPPSRTPLPVRGSWQMGLTRGAGDLKNSFPIIFSFPQLSFSLQSKGPVVWEEATKTNPGRKTEIARKKCYSADNLRPLCALHSFQLPL